MPFSHSRIVRFQDTDAAGVVYFANILSICHEAYEASLMASGIDLKAFFTQPKIAIPLTHTSADFRRPIYCGDELVIHVMPQQLSEEEFEINYQVMTTEQLAAKAITRHVCIHPEIRKRAPLPKEIRDWLIANH